MSHAIMDTFTGQDNEEVTKLSRENNCVLIIVSHNLTYKFQPLDITFNKPSESFIEEKYNIWYTEQVTKQLNEGKDPADVEVLLNLSQIKPLHAKWIFEMCKYLQGLNDLIINGLKAAGITEAVEKANEVFHRMESPFIVYRSEQD